MAEIRDVDSKGEVIKPVEVEETVHTADEDKYEKFSRGLTDAEIQFKAISDVLGIENESEAQRNQSKINVLLDYAKSQTDDHSPENLKWVIRSLELKLGTPPFAEKRINWVSRYAFLMTQEKKIADEKRKFEQK